jgi:hypothetical protein
MRVFVHEKSVWKPLFILSTAFVDTEDLMKEMRKHVFSDGTVQSMYAEFENTKVPLCHADEIRVIAQLAAAYHNASLASRLAGDKDLYGNSYSPDAWPDPAVESSESKAVERLGVKISKELESKKPANLDDSVTATIHRHEKNDSYAYGKTSDHWDEQTLGDRVVYDASFEMNEDLVPWKTNKRWAEKFGFYE